MSDLIDEAIQTARYLMVDLSPPVLEHSGLMEAIQWLRLQMEERYDLTVAVEGPNTLSISREEMRILLFQIVRELLLNFVDAKTEDPVRVAIAETENYLTIDVDGPAASADAPSPRGPQGARIGLHHVQGRLSLFDGLVDTVSTEEGRSRTTILVPLVQL